MRGPGEPECFCVYLVGPRVPRHGTGWGCQCPGPSQSGLRLCPRTTTEWFSTVPAAGSDARDLIPSSGRTGGATGILSLTSLVPAWGNVPPARPGVRPVCLVTRLSQLPVSAREPRIGDLTHLLQRGFLSWKDGPQGSRHSKDFLHSVRLFSRTTVPSLEPGKLEPTLSLQEANGHKLPEGGGLNERLNTES